MAHKVTTELQTAEHKYIMSNIVIKNIKIHGPLASAHIYINMYDCSSSCSSNQRLPKKKNKKSVLRYVQIWRFLQRCHVEFNRRRLNMDTHPNATGKVLSLCFEL